MSYSLDKIYALVGREDRVAILTFRPESVAAKLYGDSITVVFVYSQFEKEKYEAKFKAGIDEGKVGLIKAKYLGYDKPDELKNKLLKDGIGSSDISSIFQGFWPHENLYHEEKTRTIRKLNIPLRTMPKGGDYDWMFGMKKRFLQQGIGLSPHDRDWYLAMKKFYEPENLSEGEKGEMTVDGVLKPRIEKNYLEIKLGKEIITEEEEKRFDVLLEESFNANFEILKKELNDAGTSVEKLFAENRPLLYYLMRGCGKFIPQAVNVMGKCAVYMDFKTFLHVYLRHVEEFRVADNFKEKDKFLWNPDDVTSVIENVIRSTDEEIQKYWEAKPNNRFSKYGDQSIYYEGDYYTFHIEADGRLSTFHRNKKGKD